MLMASLLPVVILMTSQFQDLNNKLSAFVENRGPSIVTTVPFGDHVLLLPSCFPNTSSAASANTDEVVLQKVGCIGI